ncbi:MAG: ABC transporter permease [Clostridia bacterium]|nr:ABC transporter permease [Clostridia bacterium]
MMLFADILSSTILFAIPLLLVALGGMCSERSGIINIALEGVMIVGALISCLMLSEFDNAYKTAAAIIAEGGALTGGQEFIMNAVENMPQLLVFFAIAGAAVAGIIYSLLLAFASINLKADQTIGGTALNMLAPAFAIVLTWAIQGQGNTTILIPNWVRITVESSGAVYGNGFMESAKAFFEKFMFKSMYMTTPIAIVLIIVVSVFIYKTRLGIRLRACGEHPQAADSVGINVYRMRYLGVAISGLLAGVGGFAFTVAAGAGFQSTVAGYGFLALAVMIFGNWKPLSILGASLFFAFFKIIGSYSDSIPFMPSFEGVKSSEYIYLMLPYIVTMILLVLTSKKSRAPKAEGVPYDKSSR